MHGIASVIQIQFFKDMYNRWKEQCQAEGCTEEELSPFWLDPKHFIVQTWKLEADNTIQVFHINERVGGNLVGEWWIFPNGEAWETESSSFV